MKTTELPFNVKIMDIRGNRLSVLKPVKAMDIHEGITNNFHDEGLFSVPIFGRVGTEVRDKSFSYIDIKTNIFHPVIYNTIIKLKGLYEGILMGKEYAVWDNINKDFVKSDDIDGDTGYSFFIDHWKDIKFKRTSSYLRDDKIKLIEKYKDVAMVSKILVLPAGLRDYELDQNGREKYDEVNNLYFKLLSISNTIVTNDVNDNYPILNNSRFSLQMSFNQIFDYFQTILSGKHGFLQSKWGSRRIFNGTRNVISAMDPSVENLGFPNQPKSTDTVVGMYQLAKAALPVTVYQLRSGILSTIFDNQQQVISLINKKTLQLEQVKVSSEIYDQWTTSDGLEKIINKLSERELRHRPIEIEDHYLALIYVGEDKTFRVFTDINELPKNKDRRNVRPLNLIELVYLSGYKRWNTLRAFVTRYPVTGIDSIYPSTVYVKTTIKSDIRYELNEHWEIDDPEHPASEFPKAPYNYLDTIVPNSAKLQGLGADFDGDTASFNVVISDEAIKEIDTLLGRKTAYINAAGQFRASNDIDTVAWVLKSMTGNLS